MKLKHGFQFDFQKGWQNSSTVHSWSPSKMSFTRHYDLSWLPPISMWLSPSENRSFIEW